MTDEDRIRNERLALAAMRRQERRRRPLWVRLRDIQTRAQVMSSAPTSTLAESLSSAKPESKAPPACHPLDITERLAQVEYAVELLEEQVDSELGLSPARDFKTLTSAEKDQEIMRWKGTPSHVVATMAPYLGSTPRTIERARARLGVRQSDGMPLEEERAA